MLRINVAAYERIIANQNNPDAANKLLSHVVAIHELSGKGITQISKDIFGNTATISNALRGYAPNKIQKIIEKVSEELEGVE